VGRKTHRLIFLLLRFSYLAVNDLSTILQSMAQGPAGWRPDLLSILIGVVLGALLAAAVYRLLPLFLAYRDQVMSRVRETQAWVRSGVENRFQVEMAAYVQNYHLGHRHATLDRIFVTPRLLAPPVDLDANNVPDLGPAHLARLWPGLAAGVAVPPLAGISLRTLLLSGRRVAISGEAGTGKTTTLAYCAYLCANATETGPYTFLLPLMPAFVHLAELALDAPEAAADPVFPLARALQERSGALTGPGVATLLRQKLAAGQALLLLDGWDELPPGRDGAAADWLRRLLAQHQELRVIMAAPPQGYGALIDLDFIMTGLLPWRSGEAQHFSTRWSTVFGRENPLPNRKFWRPGQPPLESTVRLWLALADGGMVPPAGVLRRQAELMETSLRASLPHNEGDPPWLAPAARDLWQQAAYELLVNAKLSLGPDEVASLLRTILADYDVGDRGSENLLRQTMTQNGPFIRWPNEHVSLFTPVWRDFLAATHLAQRHEQETMAAHVHEPYWAGVLRFYAGRAGATELAPLLLKASGSGPEAVRQILFRLADWLLEAPDKGEWRRQTLIQLGKLAMMAHEPYAVRARAVAALAQSGEPGTMAMLRELLKRPDPMLRRMAIASLAHLGSDVALDPLIQMIEDQEPHVRQAAAHALAWLDDPATEKPLLEAFIKPDEGLSQAVAEGLALNGGDHLQILEEALSEESLRIRRAAIYGLGLLDDYWAVALLEKVEREDSQWIVKSAASAALEEIAARNRANTWKRLEAGDYSWLIQWAAQRGRAVPGGAAAMPVLLETLGPGHEPAVRATAALTLGRMMNQSAVPALQAAVKDPEPAVREAAFFALTQIRRAYETPPAAPKDQRKLPTTPAPAEAEPSPAQVTE
jgi:HEAT repeat protein